MARKRRVRSNPSAVLRVARVKHYRQVSLRLPDGTYASLRMITDPLVRTHHPMQFEYDEPDFKPGSRIAFGVIDTRTGAVKWNKGASLVDEAGTLIDHMLVWMFDESMPPRGVNSAMYNVEI